MSTTDDCLDETEVCQNFKSDKFECQAPHRDQSSTHTSNSVDTHVEFQIAEKLGAPVVITIDDDDDETQVSQTCDV